MKRELKDYWDHLRVDLIIKSINEKRIERLEGFRFQQTRFEFPVSMKRELKVFHPRNIIRSLGLSSINEKRIERSKGIFRILKTNINVSMKRELKVMKYIESSNMEDNLKYQ